jgi:hypothetical protein
MSVHKICSGCNISKPLNTGYYKAGLYYQKLCKNCHCRSGSLSYAQKVEHIPKKLKGFSKLPIDIQKKILVDIHNKTKYKTISDRYNIGYSSLMGWKRKQTIPAYVIPIAPLLLL